MGATPSRSLHRGSPEGPRKYGIRIIGRGTLNVKPSLPVRLLDLLTKCGQFLFKPARQFRSRSFQQLISERKKFRCQESEMLQRMTTLLSAVVVAFVAANALNAVSPSIAQAADGDARADAFVATSTFASRWSNPLDPAPSSDRHPGPLGNSEIDQPVPAALHDVTNSTKTSDRLFTAERPLYVTLIVFLASLGGALVLCVLIGGAFLYLRSMPKARRNLPPRRNVFRDGTHPVPVRPDGNAGNIAAPSDPSNPDSPGDVKPAGIRRNGADGHQAERDQRRTDPLAGHRLVRQLEDLACC
jgi:hypothetical protein